MKKIPSSLLPNYDYKLIRLGSLKDGGFLVSEKDIEESEMLISFGLGINWEFEKHYSKKTNNKVHIYDHTISSFDFISSIIIDFIILIKKFYILNFYKRFFKSIRLYFDYKNFFKQNSHFKESVGLHNSVPLTEIVNRAKKNNNQKFFLKINIEGSEYRLLDDLVKNQDLFTGLVIEFHDADLFIDKIVEFSSLFNLKILHLHGSKPYAKNSFIPQQIEITYGKNAKETKEKKKFPHKLDAVNFDEDGFVELLFD